MKKGGLILLSGIMLILLSCFWVYSQEDMEVIDNSVFEKPCKFPSVFNHDLHIELMDGDECNICHHVYNNGNLVEDESSEDQSCSECHPCEPSDNSLSLRKAFHKRCKGCHEESASGPVMCGQCHLKHTASNE